jgi:cytochrome c oxidase assembly protein subunit 15
VRDSLAGVIVTGGFASTLVLWSAWFVTHLPWLALSEQIAKPMTLGCWELALLWVGWRAGKPRGTIAGAGSGVIAAIVGLLILGSKLTETADPTAMGESSVRPNAAMMAAGFVGLGAGLGAVMGGLGGLLAGPRVRAMGLPTFAIVAVCAIAPLVFIGGLVTSTNSGMAVPDWPNTFGSNMFLYPLGPRVPADIFFEHSHRLFGTLVGLTTMVLMVWTLRSTEHRSVRPWVVGLFAFIVLQGVLGGLRVLQGSADAGEDNRWLSMLHGIKGQLAFALTVTVAVFLVPAYQAARAALAAPQHEHARRLRFLATAAMHSTILQLVLGAMYRHLRHDHVLWTHAAFALIVATFGLMAGFVASSMRMSFPTSTAASAALSSDAREPRGASLLPTVRSLGIALVVVVGLQFVLGWGTFLFGGRGIQAGNEAQALLRTAHQANGAAMLALLTALFLMGRVMAPKKA